MSPLTKLFVVLLAITSMLTTAGFIVFVTHIQPLDKQLTEQKAMREAAMAEKESATEAAGRSDAQYRQEVAQHENDRKADQVALEEKQSELNAANVTIAQLQQEKSSRDASITTLTNSVTMATETSNKLQDQVNTLKDNNDKLVQQAEESNKAISELTNNNETLKASLDNITEQLQSQKDNDQKLAGWAKDHGGDPEAIVRGPGALAAGAPSITGTVQDKNVINGNTYVTINVGSADGVSRGMQFYVLDSTSGDFLAMVTIDSVDNHEATGRLLGQPDNVDKVKPGNDVKTQLRGS